MLPLLLLLLQAPADACTLLKPADLSPFGATNPRTSDMEVPSGPAQGQKVKGCMWQVGKEGMLAISFAAAPQDPAARQAGLAMIEQTYNQLKAKGWTEQRQEFAGGMCAALAPPATEKGAPFTTGCMTEARGMALSVSALGKTKVEIAQLKALLDKLVQRLQ